MNGEKKIKDRNKHDETLSFLNRQIKKRKIYWTIENTKIKIKKNTSFRT